jgi:Zn-finger nucleic acid-binding protein
MDCPKCVGQLLPQSIQDLTEVYRCNECAGIWCTPESLTSLQSVWMSEAILDTGDPRIGQKLDRLQTGICPNGHGTMSHVRDADQIHIGYESCDTCHGVYLDAGEFTDLKHHTALDTLKKLVVRLKSLTLS